MKNTWQMFKTEMLINQSKANLDVKILFDKITHLLSRFSTRRIFPRAAERLLFLKQCTRGKRFSISTGVKMCEDAHNDRPKH